MKCDSCGKTVQFGNNVSHSKQRTRRRWLPNIQQTTVQLDGKPRRANLCARCMRGLYKMA